MPAEAQAVPDDDQPLETTVKRGWRNSQMNLSGLMGVLRAACFAKNVVRSAAVFPIFISHKVNINEKFLSESFLLKALDGLLFFSVAT
ncbi:hypothetical protein [Gluconobacter aidae]|uniref:Uncharacterized protein n=1 Tax=Gluconobacter aidae TaxID=2662454 RepID=A0A7X1SRX5_9PROT|nr:hypothetical protein [Gluconobacter aidae]MQR99219.1 hypothetical protein [Gluconobacter aidae]